MGLGIARRTPPARTPMGIGVGGLAGRRELLPAELIASKPARRRVAPAELSRDLKAAARAGALASSQSAHNIYPAGPAVVVCSVKTRVAREESSPATVPI